MYRGYITYEDKASLVVDNGRIIKADNVDNLKDILVLENTLENYNEDYSDLIDYKNSLINRNKNNKSMAIACASVGLVSPFMSYELGKLMVKDDVADITIPLGCVMGSVLLLGAFSNLIASKNSSKLKKLDVNIKKIDLVTKSLEDVIKIEKEKSKKISEKYKVINNLELESYDTFVEYYDKNKDNLLEEYNRKEIITESTNDQLYNKVLTRMLIRDKGLIK